MTGFSKICAMMAAISCYIDGMGIKEIARQANVRYSTVRRWLVIQSHGCTPQKYREIMNK